MDAAAEAPPVIVKEEKPKLGQQGIKAGFATATGVACDEAIAEFFYGCNISPSVANHPLFKKLVTTLKAAPASYKAPDRNRLGGDLLDSTTARLKAEEAPSESGHAQGRWHAPRARTSHVPWARMCIRIRVYIEVIWNTWNTYSARRVGGCGASAVSWTGAGRALSRASREGGGQQHTATGPIHRPCCLERTCPRVRVYP